MSRSKRIKVKKKYSRYFDSLVDHDIVLINNFGDYGAIKRTINSIEKDLFLCCPVGHNIFAIAHKGKKPKKEYETENFSVYNI